MAAEQSEPPGIPSSGANTWNVARTTRCLHVVVFIAIWMALGWGFHLKPNAYLVLGVPLLALFQLGWRRKPLYTLWVCDAASFRPSAVGWIIGLALAILPAKETVGHWPTAPWSATLWRLSCIVGAFATGFAFTHFNRSTGKDLWFCLKTGGTIGCLFMLSAAFFRHTLGFSWSRVYTAVHSFILYVPVSFVLEEVVFRGALDAHVQHPGEAYPWFTAFFVSALWGLWHLPILQYSGLVQFVGSAIAMPLIHGAIGVFLSMGWRRSGNLAVPAIVHAFIDAVRNAVLM